MHQRPWTFWLALDARSLLYFLFFCGCWIVSILYMIFWYCYYTPAVPHWQIFSSIFSRRFSRHSPSTSSLCAPLPRPFSVWLFLYTYIYHYQYGAHSPRDGPLLPPWPSPARREGRGWSAPALTCLLSWTLCRRDVTVRVIIVIKDSHIKLYALRWLMGARIMRMWKCSTLWRLTGLRWCRSGPHFAHTRVQCALIAAGAVVHRRMLSLCQGQ